MELVGRYVSVVEKDGTIFMSFRCTNKELFRNILVPPVLKNLPSHVVRIRLHKLRDKDTNLFIDQWIMNHWEEL